jgi:hypothetical protein
LKITDQAGIRLPIKIDTTSNGEFMPVRLSRANREANLRAHEEASSNAKRLNLSKRQFLISACGAASTLLAFNTANAAAGKKGGFFDLPAEAAFEPQLAQARVGGKGEFIFDVQGHFVDPTGAWVKNASPSAFKWSPKAGCALAQRPEPMSHLACLGPEEFVKDVFLDSDTDMMVLSFVPSTRDAEPLTIQAGRGAAHRRSAPGHAPPDAARARQSQPGGRSRGDGRAESALGCVRVEDLHPVRARRARLLPDR